jgi:predicted dehydrogenase
MTESARTAVRFIGESAGADAWARALRGVDGVELTRTAAAEDAFLAALADERAAAVVIAEPLPDLAGAVKRCVLAGQHVFVTALPPLASRQFAAIDELARRRQRVVLFDTPALADEHIAFVRRMTQGPNAIWRPRYVRVLRTGSRGGTALDDVALAEVVRTLAIAGDAPERVSAFAPRVDDESGAADVAMITLQFAHGPVARIDVSLLEPAERDEAHVVCDGRTIVLQPRAGDAALQIQAAAQHRGPRPGTPWAETISEYPAGPAPDRMAAAASAFVAAARGRDLAATNARDAARAALVWERARASMAAGGEILPVADGDAEAARPELRVIEGGGRRIASRAPRLTVVGR